MVTQKEIIEALRKSSHHTGESQRKKELANRIEAEGIAPPDMWQPIETAPKDGSRILISDGNFVGSGSYRYPRIWGNTTKTFVFECQDMVADATRWMPLPTAPKGAVNEQ